MISWIANLSVLDWTFLTFAVLGSLLFLVRLVLMFVGLGGGEGGDVGHAGADVGHAGADVGHAGGDVGHAGADVGHAGADAGHAAGAAPGHDAAASGHHDGSADSYVGFKLVSFQGMTAFFMMFGLVGLAMSKGSGFGPFVSLAAAVLGGLLCVFIIGQLFRMFGKLQSSGTLDYRNAVGKVGMIYMNVPAGKEPGKVRVEVQERLMILDAVSEDGRAIATDTRVTVVRIVSGNVLVVKPE